MNLCPSDFNDGHAQDGYFPLTNQIFLVMSTIRHAVDCGASCFPCRWCKGRFGLQSLAGQNSMKEARHMVIFPYAATSIPHLLLWCFEQWLLCFESNCCSQTEAFVAALIKMFESINSCAQRVSCQLFQRLMSLLALYLVSLTASNTPKPNYEM